MQKAIFAEEISFLSKKRLFFYNSKSFQPYLRINKLILFENE